jgi:hypothetical protein
MTTISEPNDTAVLMQLAKGSEALKLLAMLVDHVAEYDVHKARAEKAYIDSLNNVNATLSARVSGLILTAVRRMDALEDGIGLDDDDDE